jgi:glycosyltransferase involved in cell wall biosynthesis
VKALVVGSWPPRRSPRAIQNARLFATLGWDGRVLAPRWGPLAPGDEYDGPLPERMAQDALPNPAMRRTRAVLKRLPVKAGAGTVPDRQTPWALLAGAAAARALRRERYDLLVTISHPLSSHLAGLLARAAGPRVPWLAYFSDPWTAWKDAGFGNPSAPVTAVNAWLERRVLASADAAVFATEELAAHTRARQPVLAGKVVDVVPHSFADDLYPPRPPGPPPDGVVRVRFVGSFYGPRQPRALLQALHRLRADGLPELRRVAIELYGTWDDDPPGRESRALMTGLPMVVHHGPVAYRQALALMAGADLLLHLDLPMDQPQHFRPSKLVEYLGAGRPLLALCSPGAGAAFVRDVGGLWADVRSADRVTAAVREALTRAVRGDLAALTPRDEARAAYRADRVAARFAAVAGATVRAAASRGAAPAARRTGGWS